MVNIRNISLSEDKENTPVFWDPDTRKEVNIETSKKILKKKIAQAGLDNLILKGHSLRISGATSFANSGPEGIMTAGFMGLWKSNAKWRYMYAYQRTLEKASLNIGRETNNILAKTQGKC